MTWRVVTKLAKLNDRVTRWMLPSNYSGKVCCSIIYLLCWLL